MLAFFKPYFFNIHAARLGALALVAACGLALAACSSTPNQDDQKTWAADKLYQSAKSDISVGNYEAALKSLAILEARFPFGAFAQQAQLDTAYVKYKQNEMPDALVAVDRFMRLYPNHAATDYAMYLKGLINFNENQGFFARVGNQDLSERDMKAARDGFDNFKELVTRFPQSRYAPEARQRMNYLVNNIAAGEVHVARYYFRRGAYVAAANRAKEVVRGYSDAPAIEEALAILWRSYEQLGIPDLASDAQRVLTTNYPKSDYLTAAIIQDDRRWWQQRPVPWPVQLSL
jgi:outer membrane protein assembly factor BamD